jgi:FtsP/CotA-like multicopper oxidase with cupredoxin domain
MARAWHHNATAQPQDAYNVTTVEFGKTYRFRIINSAQLIMFNYAIANHTMTVVAVEGTYLANPYQVESLDVAPGERYDVLVNTSQGEPGIFYWIETIARYREVPGVFGRALLHYSGTAGTNTTTTTTSNTTDANTTDAADDTVILFSDYPIHPEWNDTTPSVAFDEAATTANVEAHPREKAALTADEADIDRYILVGTQNRTLCALALVVVLYLDVVVVYTLLDFETNVTACYPLFLVVVLSLVV